MREEGHPTILEGHFRVHPTIEIMPSTTTSLLAGLKCQGNVHLIVGGNALASTRCTQSLNVGARPIVLAPGDTDLPQGLLKKIEEGQVRWEKKAFQDEDLLTLGREEVDGVVDVVFVTSGSNNEQNTHTSNVCKRNRIPINVIDAPSLCTLTLLSTHTDHALQIGVTTNGNGCKLASRIRREIASSLPQNLGLACERLGQVRRKVQEFDSTNDGDDSVDQGAQFNELIPEGGGDSKGKRIRWLSQICEYWPLRRLADIQDADIETLFRAYQQTTTTTTSSSSPSNSPQGKVILAGSGPGHPSLLTLATHRAILTADTILADKLVPSQILALIPRRTPLHIARKFPGNADLAQQELQDLALAGVQAGKTVLRLKQGDPYVYGRGGEEVDFFEERGLGDRVEVLPGVTSALSAPLFAGIAVTRRDVADQVLICTGTGKKGKPPAPPTYIPTRTTIFLMALHRIQGLVTELTTRLEAEEDQTRVVHPLDTPCAVIERASCPDQRVIRTTLRSVAAAIESEGSRPPGLLVVGIACRHTELNKEWVVEEGFRGLDDNAEAFDESLFSQVGQPETST